jgi:hypothetical protein
MTADFADFRGSEGTFHRERNSKNIRVYPRHPRFPARVFCRRLNGFPKSFFRRGVLRVVVVQFQAGIADHDGTTDTTKTCAPVASAAFWENEQPLFHPRHAA